jgi:hypothetical protein
MHGEFTGAGAKEISLDAHEVSDIQEAIEFKKSFPDSVSTNVDLQAAFTVGQIHESGLPLAANGHHPAANTHGDGRGFQLFFGRIPVLLKDLQQRMARGIGVWVKGIT